MGKECYMRFVVETDSSHNNLSRLMRPLMRVRNLNQMINHKPKLKPGCTPNIRINNT